MPPTTDLHHLRPTHERILDVLLFLLSQSASPSRRDWFEAVDDMFAELTEAEKHRMVEAGLILLERSLNPAPRLRAA
ncbi:hypothetical protein U8607_08365 [Methylobacterium durans]|uniref:Uncharacterized protein n=1 Tax=Methylobacterium durans TaxID=2202825 RepID=A0A2U8W5Q7_9HYPH|nr:hypothetical protein [Methylobacterium durans]AWN41397.1 hypothetical protein DK389_13840 [Methylobacterium durans]MEA1832095.1 hypothetical protein [Methylobacterium durans]